MITKINPIMPRSEEGQERRDDDARAFWLAYREKHGMPRPTYTKADRITTHRKVK